MASSLSSTFDSAYQAQAATEIAETDALAAKSGVSSIPPANADEKAEGAAAMGKPCVLVGVTGCIAAYKACEIVRGLQKSGIRVKVVMTEHACKFVDPTTFRALTREPVAVRLFDEPGDPIHHVSLAQECDAFLVAPCTANVAAKMAAGIADDLLTTTALATTAPLIIAPAMNVHMYENPATCANLRTLKGRGVHIVEADEGYLACGDTGKGRLADVGVIVRAVLRALGGKASGEPRDLEGVSVLVTAGPTVEPIDAVRYLSNHSSGKMGFAIAKAARRRGANVTLVSGPVSLPDPEGVSVAHVRTACEMLEATEKAFASADIAVFSAAVADMRPAHAAVGKLKKGVDDDALSRIELVRNPDILATCARNKRPGQIIVGFAAETEAVVEYARGKLVRKNADLVVANQVGEDRAFGTDDNEAFLVTAENVEHVPLMAKDALAERILDAALSLQGSEGRAGAK